MFFKKIWQVNFCGFGMPFDINSQLSHDEARRGRLLQDGYSVNRIGASQNGGEGIAAKFLQFQKENSIETAIDRLIAYSSGAELTPTGTESEQ